jgi:hypothetical protein
MTKEQFLEKHKLSELDWRNLIRYEEARKTGKMNMFEYLNIMREFNANGGKRLAQWIMVFENYKEFLEVLNGDE